MNVFSIWLFHHIILDNIYIMQIYKDLPTTHKDNTHVICVTIDSNEENTDIWNNCISSEFPIINMDMEKDEAICQIGSPHHGYTLKASQKSGKLDGEAFLYDYDNQVVASFTYQEGVANGKCRMYYRSGETYFSGFLQEGYRNGPGVEYRKDGSTIYEGFFKNGRRAPNIQQRSDGSNYWDEKDEDGKMVSLFQIDDNGLNHGICYFYCNGEISKISRWGHGKETELLMKFNGPIMKVLKNGIELYSGGYRKESDFEYIPSFKMDVETESDSEESIEEEKECTSTDVKVLFVKIELYLVYFWVFELVIFIILLFTVPEISQYMIFLWLITFVLILFISMMSYCVPPIVDCFVALFFPEN